MNLLVFLLILLVVFGVIAYFLSTLTLPDPWNMLIRAVMAIIAIVILLGVVFGGVPVPKIL